jgi:hypothetical protein
LKFCSLWWQDEGNGAVAYRPAIDNVWALEVPLEAATNQAELHDYQVRSVPAPRQPCARTPLMKGRVWQLQVDDVRCKRLGTPANVVATENTLTAVSWTSSPAGTEKPSSKVTRALSQEREAKRQKLKEEGAAAFIGASPSGTSSRDQPEEPVRPRVGP